MNDIKKLATGLLVALIVQTIGGLVWAGGAAARISTLEERVGEQRLVAERLARRAFGDSLARTGAAGVRMLHQHEARAVVGVWDAMVEDERGLFVRGRIEDWSAEARFAQALSRAGALDGLSIGFRAAKARRD